MAAGGFVQSVNTSATTAGPPPVKTLDLDASQFTPISSKDALSAASTSKTVLNNPWWGRLDTIPPASDERTMLIDRTLVAYGLLAPDDLVEIHKIGDQMLEISGDRALAATQARAAVEASDAERKRIKEQKKADAVERKRKHAEGVAHRKLTDIIFLGRGVSKGLADRRANVEKLPRCRSARPRHAGRCRDGHVSLDTATPLAGLPLRRLRNRTLRPLHRPEKIGGRPRARLPASRPGHRPALDLRKYSAAAADAPGCARIRKAPFHQDQRRAARFPAHARQRRPEELLSDDNFPPCLRRFSAPGIFPGRGNYPRIDLHRVAPANGRVLGPKVSRRDRPAGSSARCLHEPCHFESHRPPARFTTNWNRAKLGWQYTRYADDLSFSANAEADPAKKTGYLLARIRHIAEDEGFEVNETKTRVLKRSTAMAVTGIVVNDRPGVRRREVRQLRAILHNARKHGLASQNRTNRPHFESQLRGRVEFVRMINPKQAASLVAAFENLPDVSKQKEGAPER